MNKYFATHFFILLLLFSQLIRVQHIVDHAEHSECCDSVSLTDKEKEEAFSDNYVDEDEQECSLCLLIGHTSYGYCTDSVYYNLPLQSFHNNEYIRVVSKYSFYISSRGPPTYHL